MKSVSLSVALAVIAANAAMWIAGCGSSKSAGSGTPFASCAALAFAADKEVATLNTDELTWQDAACEPRTAALSKGRGAQALQFSYIVDGSPRMVTGTNANGWAGFGYIVTHYAATAASSQGASSTSAAVLVGRHHAIYRFTLNHDIGGQNVPVTVDWFVATGRDNPVYAITYDASGTLPGSLAADTRAPYGDMSWQGDDAADATVSGVGWGDRYKFVTTTEPLTRNSAWDYTAGNTIPYVYEWQTNPDAEMGSVETQTYLQHDGGGYQLYKNWGKTSANQITDAGQLGVMPVAVNWTYQLNQYELCYPETAACLGLTTRSHRLCWGANYGAVGGATAGSPSYAAYGDDRQLVGHPYQSYAVYVVLGKHSDAVVARQVTQVEIVQQTTLTASVGTVDVDGPGGVGRTDTVTLDPPGYDQRYGVWSVTSAANAVKFDATVSSGTLAAPILVVNGYSRADPPAVTVGGRSGAADIDYFMSLDTAKQQVWITFRKGWTGTQTIEVK
jgi:hypothetical protein